MYVSCRALLKQMAFTTLFEPFIKKSFYTLFWKRSTQCFQFRHQLSFLRFDFRITCARLYETAQLINFFGDITELLGLMKECFWKKLYVIFRDKKPITMASVDDWFWQHFFLCALTTAKKKSIRWKFSSHRAIVLKLWPHWDGWFFPTL